MPDAARDVRRVFEADVIGRLKPRHAAQFLREAFDVFGVDVVVCAHGLAPFQEEGAREDSLAPGVKKSRYHDRDGL